MFMGLAPSEVRSLTLPQFLMMQDAYARAHAAPGKGGAPPAPPPPPADIARLLKARES
jgi:hypothetical protein